MKNFRSKYQLAMAALVVLVVTMGCAILQRVTGGKITTDTASVEAGDATAVKATIQLGFGELKLSGGAEKLMEGTFNYNVSGWQPEVSYVVSGGEGKLSIIQPDVQGIPNNVKNEWIVQLSNSMPLELTVQTGAAKSELTIGDLMVSQVNVDAGAGETTIDLTTAIDRDINVVVNTGAGAVKMLLPSSVGVKVTANVGIGGVNASGLQENEDGYVNDAFGKTEHTITVRIDSGVGGIDLEVR